MKTKLRKFGSKLYALIILMVHLFVSDELKAKEADDFNNALTIQIGANGTAHDGDFEFAFFPFDIAYSRELYEDDRMTIATSSFYDYIDTDVEGEVFEHRFGQKFDVGFEMGKYTPYLTAGLASIKGESGYKTTPIYGFGTLYRLSARWLFVNEINFQTVKRKQEHYEIVNFTSGFSYIF